MKILIPIRSFKNLTGAELYVYELARELVGFGHDVTVIAPEIGGIITEKAEQVGIKVFELGKEPKGHYDIIHAHQAEPTQYALDAYPHTPLVVTIHSEFECETPVIKSRVKKYIAIRPTVQEHLIKEHGIAEENIVVIPNPIDYSRFNENYKPVKNEVSVHLFVGTIDKLRKTTLMNLVDQAVNYKDHILRIVGDKHDTYLDYQFDNVEVLPSRWDIEEEVKRANVILSVLLGRTAIEGYLMGKRVLIHNTDGKSYYKLQSIINYNSKVVAWKILEGVYKDALVP